MTTPERIALLTECSALFESWIGAYHADDLGDWLAAEFGNAAALDEPVRHGSIRSLALAPSHLLHVVSGNTPHAAMQSMLRGLLIGSHNTLKLPSAGLPELERAVAQMPAELAERVTLIRALPEDWSEKFATIVVFGSDETIQWFKENTPPATKLVLHGQKLSIALVTGDLAAAARLAAQDVSLFDQQGCLSLHDIYLSSSAGSSAREWAELLAQEMEAFQRHTPRAELSPSESGVIASLRETVRFEAASRPHELALWESEKSTAWTVIYEQSPILRISPLNRVVFVKSWPESDPASLGPARRHLSTLALHPCNSEPCPGLLRLGASRICPLGATQTPSLLWHHDGTAPLASLTSWVDVS